MKSAQRINIETKIRHETKKAPFTVLRVNERGLFIAARDVDLTSSILLSLPTPPKKSCRYAWYNYLKEIERRILSYNYSYLLLSKEEL